MSQRGPREVGIEWEGHRRWGPEARGLGGDQNQVSQSEAWGLWRGEERPRQEVGRASGFMSALL